MSWVICLPTVYVTPFWMGWAAGSLCDANHPFKDRNCCIWRQKRSLVSFGRVKGTDMRKPNWAGSRQETGIEFLNFGIFFKSLSSSVCTNASYRSRYNYNSFMKKRSQWVLGLGLQRVSVVCAVCTVLYCFGASFLQVWHLHKLSLPEVGSVWSLGRMWWVLTGCALLSSLNEPWNYLH